MCKIYIYDHMTDLCMNLNNSLEKRYDELKGCLVEYASWVDFQFVARSICLFWHHANDKINSESIQKTMNPSRLTHPLITMCFLNKCYAHKIIRKQYFGISTSKDYTGHPKPSFDDTIFLFKKQKLIAPSIMCMSISDVVSFDLSCR